ncbi:hypothetical protein B0J11DRAFT_243598 [Dendryphion nanum]|uniref:Uncharacterized protein n=1 Tax=Dendryphion nanum TaxID=256645 RepID=A0A9P9IRR6_9PLEO|nr:hypothetical protein B0J11DRAFT_243598 [Dendryphion nanum]
MPPSRPPSSKLGRAFSSNLIFLVIAAVCGYYMDLPGMLAVSNTTENGFFHWGKVREPVLEQFHLLGFLDVIIRDVTAGFAPSIYQVDPVSWWQMIVFLIDVAPMYMVWLMESSRPLTRGSIARFPSIMATIAQFAGGGVFFPINYFLHLVYRPPSTSTSRDDLRVDLSDAFLWLPLSLLFNTAPTLAMYFAPTFATRHYYTWFWQLFTVRIGITYYTIVSLVKLTGFSMSGHKLNYQATLRKLFAPYIVLQTALWLYSIFNTPYPLRTVFVPGKIEADFAGTFIGLMRRLLQVDQWSVMGSSFLWLIYLMWDMSHIGLVSRKQLYSFPLLLAIFPLLGPGATFVVMWLWKERFVVPDESEKKRR